MNQKQKKAISMLVLTAVVAGCVLSVPGVAKSAVRLNRKKLTVEVGKKKTIKVKGTKKKATWSVKNKKIATVTKKGVVTGKKAGTTYAYAKVKGVKKLKCKVTVTKKKRVDTLAPVGSVATVGQVSTSSKPTAVPVPTDNAATTKPIPTGSVATEVPISTGNVLAPYQKYGQVEHNQTVQMAGYSYSQAVLYDIYSSSNEGANYVLYNLNGEYDTFSFTYGHVDNKYTDDCILTIYLDGNLVEQYIDLNSEMMPKNVTIDVSGVSQMKVDCRIASHWAGQCGTYALANLNFYKKTSAALEVVSNEKRVISATVPYQTFGQVECNKIVQMAGSTYQQTILYDIYSSSNEGANYVLYNLNGEYETFSFTYGHVDNKYIDDCMLTIYLDGSLVEQYTDLNSEMMPKNVTINVSGISQMKVDCRIASHWAGQCGTYALANLNFQKKL